MCWGGGGGARGAENSADGSSIEEETEQSTNWIGLGWVTDGIPVTHCLAARPPVVDKCNRHTRAADEEAPHDAPMTTVPRRWESDLVVDSFGMLCSVNTILFRSVRILGSSGVYTY